MLAPRFDPSSLSQDVSLERDEEPFNRKRKLSDSLAEGESSSESENSSECEDSSTSSDDEKNDSSEMDVLDSSSGEDEQMANSALDTVLDGVKGDHEVNISNSKHHSILQRLHNVAKNMNESEEKERHASDSNNDDEGLVKQDLAPLPQPKLPRDKKLAPQDSMRKNLNWLTSPIYADPSFKRPFSDFKFLSSFMLRNLNSMGYEEAFSVQNTVLEILLQDIDENKLRPDIRGDLLVNAATGSGKTIAYLIPIIEALHDRIVPRVRAIILVPTKPLISQVKSTMSQLSKGTSLSIVSLKSDLSIQEEARKLKAHEPDVIVSTPGRLVEHLSNNTLDLSALRFLVIDEADRLLNQSFQNWCDVLISKIEDVSSRPSMIFDQWKLKTQKLIFSATLTTDAGKIAGLQLQRPRLVIVNDKEQMVNEMFSVPPNLLEYKIQVGAAKSSIKPLILARFLLQSGKTSNVLVFAKSNEASIRLAKLLQILMNSLSLSHQTQVAYLNSTNNSTSVRQKTLKEFSTQKIGILVATDLIARGIDILSITDVVNYDLPISSREYVHRVGRTARANNHGNAYTFCFGRGEGKWFDKVLSNVGRSGKNVSLIALEINDLLHPEDRTIYEKSLQELQSHVLKRH